MDCLKKENLTKFLAGDGTGTERNALEMHLADCPKCRLKLTNFYAEKTEEIFPAPKYLKKKAKRLPEKENIKTPFFSFSFLLTRQTALAMASFIVLFSLIGLWVWSDQTNTGPEDVLRQGGQKTTAPVLLVPEDNADLAGEEIKFSWQSLAGANSYVLIVSDEKGDIVLEKQTKEESLSIKTSDAKLIPGKHYFWHIRAKFIDGKITETEPRKFTFKK